MGRSYVLAPVGAEAYVTLRADEALAGGMGGTDVLVLGAAEYAPPFATTAGVGAANDRAGDGAAGGSTTCGWSNA